MEFILLFSMVAIATIFGASSDLNFTTSTISSYDEENLTEDENNFEAEGGGVTSHSELLKFANAAVTCDAPLCSEISKNILEKGGAIGDAAVAGILCLGIIHPQSSGLGGGLVAVHYDPATRQSTVISAREQAPMAANESMFDHLPFTARSVGSLAIAVPAEIKGLEELYQRYGGKLSWAELFEPSIKLLEEGFKIDSHLAFALKSSEKLIKKDPGLSLMFVNDKTGKVFLEGDTLTIPVLAETFKIIARDGGKAFYDEKSLLAKKVLMDLNYSGAIITDKDISSFSLQIQNSVQVNIINLNLHTAGPPSSGATMAFILRILEKYKETLKPDDLLTSQIFVEALKTGYGRRGHLGDPEDPQYKNVVRDHVQNLVQNEEYLEKVMKKIKLNFTSNTQSYYQDAPSRARSKGTAHLSIIGQDGQAISVTTTIGKFFGAKVASRQTGIIFNNKMSNFEIYQSTRAKSPNKIGPGKRPMNTVCPSIWTDETGKVRLVIGGAGGMKIISSVTSSTMNHLWLGMNVKEAISARRVHHSLRPMLIEYEPGYNETFVNTLQSYGHKLKRIPSTASVVGISRDHNDNLFATWDPRKPGSAAGY